MASSTSRASTTVPATSQSSTTVKLSTTTLKVVTLTYTTRATKATTTTTTTLPVTSSVPRSTAFRSTSTPTSAPIVTKTSPQRVPIPNQTKSTAQSKTTARPSQDYSEVKGEDEHDMESDDLPLPAPSNETDNIVNERFMMGTKDDGGSNITFIVNLVVIAFGLVLCSTFVVLIVYKQYKKSTNPLNYKERQENGSRKANEEFSEIRFLTSDETLDFNLVSPDSTDLWRVSTTGGMEKFNWQVKAETWDHPSGSFLVSNNIQLAQVLLFPSTNSVPCLKFILNCFCRPNKVITRQNKRLTESHSLEKPWQFSIFLYIRNTHSSLSVALHFCSLLFLFFVIVDMCVALEAKLAPSFLDSPCLWITESTSGVECEAEATENILLIICSLKCLRAQKAQLNPYF